MALAQARGPEFLAPLRSRFLNAWVKTDPGAAVRALYPELESPNLTQWDVRQAVGEWLARDPGAAFEWVVARSANPEPGRQSML